MKNVISVTLLVLLAITTQAQTVWIVDNRPSAPTGAHIFGNATDAIAAATQGDVIHLIPSSVNHDDFTITKDSLVFYGIGFNPNKEIPNRSSVSNVTVASNITGIRVSGLRITNSLTLGNGDGFVSNLFIENCQINNQITTTSIGTTKTYDNIVVRNCVIGFSTGSDYAIDILTEANPNSILITNNILMGTPSSAGYGSIAVQNAIIQNNLFLGNDVNDNAFFNVSTSTISNNIFYGRAPRADGTSGSGLSNTTFNNNISFGNTDNSFGTGAGVVENASDFGDPIFGFGVTDDWDYSFDPTPSGTNALGTGNDGNDIGLTGGTLPFSTTGSPLPVIQVLRFPEIITEGTNVDATIEAEGN